MSVVENASLIPGLFKGTPSPTLLMRRQVGGMTECQIARLGTNRYNRVHKYDKNVGATSIF